MKLILTEIGLNNMSAHRITKKGYRKILKWVAQNIHDDYLADFSMEAFLDEQEYDLNEPSITLILSGDHIAGRHSVLTLYYDNGDLKANQMLPYAVQSLNERKEDLK